MQTFIRVAEMRSFSAAARSLGISAPLASRHISELEAHLEIRLLNRTTRHVELSEAGQRYYPGCVALLDQLAALEAETSGLGNIPSGLLRISMPMDFGRLFLGDAIAEYLSISPQVKLDLIYEDRPAQLLQEHIDIAIRIGTRKDSTLISRALGSACVSCFASPDYLETNGLPAVPGDLANHQLLNYSLANRPGQWSFDSLQAINVRSNSRLTANNGRALAEAACQGLGITRLPEFLVKDHVSNGTLVEVLSAYRSTPLEISAVYQHRKFKPAKVTSFIEFLSAYFQRHDAWLPKN